MMKRVAVEKSLKNVKDYLTDKGYDVSEIKNTKNNMNNFDAIVVSGQNSNFLGIQNTSTKASIVNASGMSVEDVYNELSNRFS
ncbi:YkuS family protein [Lutibacter sp. B2]|nr:YkuS family protein [Lutibacter sp. B2]